jgi:hypothetical protein
MVVVVVIVFVVVVVSGIVVVSGSVVVSTKGTLPLSTVISCILELHEARKAKSPSGAIHIFLFI